MKTCRNCEWRKHRRCWGCSTEHPALGVAPYSAWTRRRWVTLIIVAAIVLGSMVLAIGLGAALLALTPQTVNRDAIRTRLIIGKNDTWIKDIPPRRVFGVDLLIHETAESIRYDTITATAYGTVVREGKWMMKARAKL